jgi:hypothetical protein
MFRGLARSAVLDCRRVTPRRVPAWLIAGMLYQQARRHFDAATVVGFSRE